jgi:hypothetical protein
MPRPLPLSNADNPREFFCRGIFLVNTGRWQASVIRITPLAFGMGALRAHNKRSFAEIAGGIVAKDQTLDTDALC